jgi:hypothetical protein
MKLYHQLHQATPHHRHQTTTCKAGDVYGHLKLVLKEIIVTGQTRFLSVAALASVKFSIGITVSELNNALAAVQTKANRFKLNSIDDDLMKGALLTLAQRHSQFERLATDFSKKSMAAMTYQDCLGEMLQHEANLLAASVRASQRPSRQVQQLANMVTDSQLDDDDDERYELAALFAQFKAAGNKLPKKQSREACCNFLAGRCSRSAAKCNYSHDTAGRAPAPSHKDGQPADKQLITCYNCQKQGFHRGR